MLLRVGSGTPFISSLGCNGTVCCQIQLTAFITSIKNRLRFSWRLFAASRRSACVCVCTLLASLGICLWRCEHVAVPADIFETVIDDFFWQAVDSRSWNQNYCVCATGSSPWQSLGMHAKFCIKLPQNVLTFGGKTFNRHYFLAKNTFLPCCHFFRDGREIAIVSQWADYREKIFWGVWKLLTKNMFFNKIVMWKFDKLLNNSVWVNQYLVVKILRVINTKTKQISS